MPLALPGSSVSRKRHESVMNSILYLIVLSHDPNGKSFYSVGSGSHLVIAELVGRFWPFLRAQEKNKNCCC